MDENPIRQEVDKLAIYKRDGGVVLGNTVNSVLGGFDEMNINAARLIFQGKMPT